MTILGIDPGLSITGYAVVSAANWREVRLVEAGAIRPGRGEGLPGRLRCLHEDLAAVIAEFRPSRVVVEQVFVHRQHVRAAVQMGHARGVILLAAAAADVAVDEFSPAEIKKSLTGHGRASKSQMQSAVMHALGLPKPPEPADVADAIAMALCGARRRGEATSPRLAAIESGESALAVLAARGVSISSPDE